MPRSLPAEARAAVLGWYDAGGRALAFRTTRDPYAVLVSEVMAQQTQVSRVVEAWPRFLDRFPTVAALADASPADVLRSWQGLGYDRRAVNLWRAARAIRDRHGGGLPSAIDQLEALPGVGPYTARAIAAIAFGAPAGAVDTNVRRVLTRSLALGSEGPVGGGDLQEAADASVDPDRPGDWTHALMDVGATLCRPRSPSCPACPLQAWCRWAADGRTSVDSVKPKRRSERGRSGSSETRPVSQATRRSAAPLRSADVPFQHTTRWLRGRIVDRLRAADGSTWTIVTGPIGAHEHTAVLAALEALARDGVIELDRAQPGLARLATA